MAEIWTETSSWCVVLHAINILSLFVREMSNVAKSPSLTRHIFVGLDDSELYLKFIAFPAF